MNKTQSEVHQISRSPLKHDVFRNNNAAMLEMTERNECCKNLLLYNIPESSAQLAEVRVKDDLDQVMAILNPLGNFPQPRELFRLGSVKTNVARSLKIV